MKALHRKKETRTNRSVGKNQEIFSLDELKCDRDTWKDCSRCPSNYFSVRLLENSPNPILVVNPDASIRYVNPAFEKLLGCSSEEIVGSKLPFVWWTEDAFEENKRLLELAFREGLQRVEKLFQKKNGELFWVEITSRPIIFDGKFQYYLANWVDITDRKKVENALRERTANLEEMNTALKILLEKRENDKADLEEKVLSNIRQLIVPYLERLRNTRLDEQQGMYLAILESTLDDIVSPFSRRLSCEQLSFTPSEIKIAHLVKRGDTTKEIAHLMNLSERTIDSHRKNIRRKLRIMRKKVNLRTYLLSIQ